ncbi:hypothetical protein RvY_09408 [Ramazzottius varieornatus]|uniref:Uncharacterized protein n=1 Tax=Ramazzottius varieornatus TaxID=947166 RepID=A0A1D1VH60_RAMVA|nr:hypothetical protein RvY_09408 [Ramazzottius varieornatus]
MSLCAHLINANQHPGSVGVVRKEVRARGEVTPHQISVRSALHECLFRLKPMCISLSVNRTFSLDVAYDIGDIPTTTGEAGRFVEVNVLRMDV